MGIWDLIAEPVLAIINKEIPDKTAAAKAAAQLEERITTAENQLRQTQLDAVTKNQTDVNKVEAGNVNMFVAGWRPFVGWICGTALGISTIVAPIFTWVSALIGHPTPFPDVQSPLLQSTLAGMLGLGFGLRTFEKAKSIASNH
jgi:Holin of 3TMs, for gene-transfer release